MDFGIEETEVGPGRYGPVGGVFPVHLRVTDFHSQ